ncbi:MAG: O-antigen ligase family protein [Terriglobales bacterium]
MSRRTTPLVIDMPPPQERITAPVAPAAARLDQAMFVGLLALLMFGPLAFGATEPWSQFVQRMTALVLLGMWTARQYFQASIELGSNPVLLPAALLFAFTALQFATGSTAYRYATLSAALNLVPCGIVLLIAGDLFSRRRKLRDFVTTMSVFGFIVALFALIQDLSNSDKIYWLVRVHGISAAMYGAYANHNHYAGLMEMLVPLAGAAAFLERGGKRGLLLFATAVMAVSIVFSRSRGGMLGLLVAVIFVCAVLFRMHRRGRVLLGVLGIVTATALLVLFLGTDRILQRLTETQDNYRLAIYRDCLRMCMQKPFLGFGWGTFSTVYPEYRSFFTNLFVNSAHNDYLELLVETGGIGIALAGWFLFAVFRSGFRKIFDPADYEGSVLAIGVTTGVMALLVHSALDFNLHIPANAALFYALCSAAATPYRHHVRRLEFTSAQPELELATAEQQ